MTSRERMGPTYLILIEIGLKLDYSEKFQRGEAIIVHSSIMISKLHLFILKPFTDFIYFT